MSGPTTTAGEPFRATLVAHTADGERATLIVTRQAGHRAGPVWLSLLGSVQTTIALADDEVGELTGLLTAAALAGAARGAVSRPSRAAVDAAADVITTEEGAVLQRMLKAAYAVDRAPYKEV